MHTTCMCALQAAATTLIDCHGVPAALAGSKAWRMQAQSARNTLSDVPIPHHVTLHGLTMSHFMVSMPP
jgi:hypothetical protein